MGHCPPEKEQACVLGVQNGPCGVGNLSLCSPYRGSKSLSNNVHKESSYFFQTSRSIPIYPHIHMLLVSPSPQTPFPLITTTIFSSLHLSYKQKLKLALTEESLRIRSFRGDRGHCSAWLLLSERDRAGCRYDCAPGPCACSRNPPLEGDRRSCGDMLIPRSRQGDRLLIRRSLIKLRTRLFPERV